eukprot:635580-Amphidinium_carterae.1
MGPLMRPLHHVSRAWPLRLSRESVLGPRYQAPSLTAEALIALENATLKSRSQADHVMAGFFVFMALARARYDE